MFTLGSGIWRYLMRRDEFRVLILGLDNSGKTTFLEAIKQYYLQIPPIPSEKILPTIGLNMAEIDMGKIKVIVWDLGGKSEVQSLWQKYYTDCHAVIYVVDSSNNERLLESIQMFRKWSREGTSNQ